MGLFDALMKRKLGSFAGLVSDETKSFLDSKRPLSEKRWLSWVLAEQFRLQGDMVRGSQWLNIATHLTGGKSDDVVWQAEYSSTVGELLLAAGEPAQAFGHLQRSFEAWTSVSNTIFQPLAGKNVDRSVGASVAHFTKILLSGEGQRIDPGSPKVMITWMQERFVPRTVQAGLSLIRVASSAGGTRTAQEVARRLLEWMPKAITGTALACFVSDVHRDLGNHYQEVGRTEDAVGEFTKGLAALKAFPHDRLATSRILPLEFNRANGLARSGHEKEALSVYERLEAEFKGSGQQEASLRTRFAGLHLRWRMGEGKILRSALRHLVADYEGYLKKVSRRNAEYATAKKALEQPYRLLLTIAAQDRAEHANSLHELFGLVGALRDESALVQEEQIPGLSGVTMREVVSSPIALLERRLRRLPDAVLLLAEPGVDSVVFVALKGGTASLARRVVVATAGKEFEERAAKLLTESQSSSDLLIARAATAQGLDPKPVRDAAGKLTRAIPKVVLKAISDAAVVFYSPSSMGQMDSIPLELILTGEDHLGLARIVSRVPSLRHLLEILAPNRLNRDLSAQAAIVRALDPPDLDPLDNADEDAERITRAADVLGLDARIEKVPEPRRMLETLDSGIRLLHYIGHGMANEAGEKLYLKPTSSLHASELSALDGSQTPFVYLSACFVGQARHLAGGRLKGFGVALLEHGAPGVVAANYAVPDHVCGQISLAFYRGAWKAPVGEAMRQARLRLHSEGNHPVSWASFSLHGDPYTTISGKLKPDSLAHRTCDWPALLTRFLATKDESYRRSCLDGLREARKTSSKTQGLFDAVITVVEGKPSAPKKTLSLIHDLAAVDVEGAAALRILHAQRRIESVRKKKMSKADQELCRQEIGTALSLALSLRDSYAFVAFAVAHDELLMTTMQEKIAVLRHADRCLGALRGDASRLQSSEKRIRSTLKSLTKATVFDVHSLLGVDAELVRRADEGDEDALREINSQLMAKEAGVNVALSGGHWADWMLRFIGTDSQKVLSGLMGVIDRDRKSRALNPRVADLLWKYLSSYRGPGEADPGLYRSLQEELSPGSKNQMALELFRLYDLCVSRPESYPRAVAAEGLALAEKLKHEGASAYFQMLVSQVEIRERKLGPAKDLLFKTLEPLHRLAKKDREYLTRLRMAVQNARALSQSTRDLAALKMINKRFGADSF